MLYIRKEFKDLRRDLKKTLAKAKIGPLESKNAEAELDQWFGTSWLPCRQLFMGTYADPGSPKSSRRPPSSSSVSPDDAANILIAGEEGRGKKSSASSVEKEKGFTVGSKATKDADFADQSSERPLRLFMEGAFDLTHYGHFNALRQAKECGGYLIAGVNSTSTIEECKGCPPLLTDEERQIIVGGCRFVDEVVPELPYKLTKEETEQLIK